MYDAWYGVAFQKHAMTSFSHSRATSWQGRLLLAALLVIASAGVSAACTTYWNAEALGDTQVDSVALYNLRGVPVAHLTTARLKQLVEIKDKLAYAAHIKATLLLCDDRSPNAMALTIGGLRLVVFNLGIFDLLQWNADAVAGVMAHEISHLSLGHSPAAQLTKAKMTLESILNPGKYPAKVPHSPGLAAMDLSANMRQLLLLFEKFSRDDEQAADDEGRKLMTSVGFNPEGAAQAEMALLNKFGNIGGGYLDTHPALKDRIEKAQLFVATDSAAKQLVAGLKVDAAVNDELTLAAEQLIQSNSWKRLDALTNEWLSRNDQNTTALYYRGVYESSGLGQIASARRMFLKAVEIDPDNAKARLELCVALFKEGRKLESTYCYRNIATENDREIFKARTFGENLWIGGEIEPFTTVVVTRDESGAKYVTNLELAKQRHLEIPKFSGE